MNILFQWPFHDASLTVRSQCRLIEKRRYSRYCIEAETLMISIRYLKTVSAIFVENSNAY
jgi:hypothetical protein